ncbi:MAG: methyltransferase domain-containing protein, partial [Candidatus Hodarchaeales archaeon]
MSICRMCDTNLTKFLDLGDQPLANSFLYDHQIDTITYRLEIGICSVCNLVQLIYCPNPSETFNDNYPFFTSTSRNMELHFRELCYQIENDYLHPKSFVLEIGCNDGTLLENFARFNHLGVEPSANIAEKAREKGLDVLIQFFKESIVDSIIKFKGKADVIISTNVFPHIPDRSDVLKGIKKVLSTEGVWINEEAYLGSIVNRVSYDQFYNEHVFYSSVRSFINSVNRYDLNVFNVEFPEVHGGSVRFYVSHKYNVLMNKKIKDILDHENLSKPEVFKDFSKLVEQSRHRFLSILHALKSKGERVVGYGATAKSTTILNYCGIDKDLIDCIYDNTPAKQGKYTPGSRIPIVSHDHFNQDKPENVVLFAWNHMKEICEKEK